MAKLILSTPEGTQSVELRQRNSLGRHPNNSIQLLDKIVSKEHCIVEQRETGFVLRDLGSLNGTYVNGARVRGEAPLRHGDEITLGQTHARFDDGTGVDSNQRPPVQGAVPPNLRSPSVPPPGLSATPQQAGPPGWRVPSTAMPQTTAAPHSHLPGSVQRQIPQTGGLPGSQPQYAPPYSNQQPRPLGGVPGHGSPGPHNHGGTLGMAQSPGQAVFPNAGNPQFRPQRANLMGTRVDMLAQDRAIGTQINAQPQNFVPVEKIAQDDQIRVEYERLRITWELTRDIANETELDGLLNKILIAVFKFVRADRGVILLKEEDETLQPHAALRRDGTDAPIQVSQTILAHIIAERKAVLTHDASMDFAASKGKSMILNRITSAMVVPLLHDEDVLGAIWLDSESLAQFQQRDLEIITTLAHQASMFIKNRQLGEQIKEEIITRDRFSRLLSPNVAKQIISGKLEIKLGGELVPDCTVFNSDIRGFTRMSEGAEAGEILDLLNQYFELMVDHIFNPHEGTLDKFMGDGIMAFWGAPVGHEDDPLRAVCSALDQMSALGKLNRHLTEIGQPPLAVGMGIHTGPLVAGYCGSSKALSYTVIGDTANTSARLCGVALAGQIIVSEATLDRLGNRFEVDELPPASLKGKEKPLRIFNVKREKPSASQK